LIEQLPEASKDGIPLISDTKLRQMMPPQVKKTMRFLMKMYEKRDQKMP